MKCLSTVMTEISFIDTLFKAVNALVKLRVLRITLVIDKSVLVAKSISSIV